MIRDLKPAVRGIARNLSPEIWANVQDPRNARGIRHGLPALLSLLVLGLMTCQRTLRDVERLCGRILCRRGLGLSGTPSDTTLDRLLRVLNPSSLAAVVTAQVRAMARNKQLETSRGLPFTLVAIDGKCVGKDDQRLHPQSHSLRTEGKTWYLLKMIRAVLVSSAVAPVLSQQLQPAGKGERHGLIDFLLGLRRTFGALTQCFSFDAGFFSAEIMHDLAVRDISFIFAVKGNAGSLHTFLQHSLGVGEEDPACRWEVETVEKKGRKSITRQITRVFGDLGTCGAVRQGWRQRTIVRSKGKVQTLEDRYFVTNLARDDLSAREAMAAIRAHWAIENDSNWTMDVVLTEDTQCWVRQERAREVLTWLRIIAYNLLRLLRCRTLRARSKAPKPWRELVDHVYVALLTTPLWRRAFS